MNDRDHKGQKMFAFPSRDHFQSMLDETTYVVRKLRVAKGD